MAIDADKYAALLVQSLTAKPAVCEVLEVIWSGSITKYYGGSEWDQVMGFRGLSKRPVEARLMYPDQENDPFSIFELQGDLRTKDINFTFNDIDKDITQKFRDYGTVKCRLHYYYPTVDLLIEDVWKGQLHPPEVGGYKTARCTASNGSRSREVNIPDRMRPKECTSIFGGKFTSLAALATNGCRYDRHLGGSNGLLNGGVPFTDCPRMTAADCTARWGDAKMFLGFTLNVPDFVSDPHHGVIAHTTGNASLLPNPIRVVAGFKHLNNCNLLCFTREPNPNHPELGFIQAVWETCEGPNNSISNIMANQKAPNYNQWVIRLGGLGQSLIGYPGLNENFSLTGLFRMIIGLGDPVNITPQGLTGECDVSGNTEIAVYTDATTFTRHWTDDRVWWLFAVYENQRWALGTDPSEFWTGDFITESTRANKTVTFSHTFPSGETIAYTHRRSSMNATFEARPAADQIVDICRSGRLFVPFQYQGKYALASARPYTSGELAAAPVFTDRPGNDRNIFWDEQAGEPSINFSQIAPDKITNEIKIVFEERDNKGLDRPITVDDPDQKYRAGLARGEQFHTENKEYRAFGVDTLPETLKLGYGLLWFGEFDEGGIKNNLRGVFKCPFEWAVGLKRYQAVKIDSPLLDGFMSPEAHQFQYFRLLYINKIDHGLAELTVQAYNKEAYEAFEVEATVTTCSIDADCPTGFICVGGVCVPAGVGMSCSVDAQCPDGFVCRNGICVKKGPGDICVLDFTVTSDVDAGLLNVAVDPCP